MQSGLEILSWSFWSPETREPAKWREAAAQCEHIAVPDHAIPPTHRRRMSTLSKMAVQTALEATRDARPDFLVFCSQHGEVVRTRELLAAIVAHGELSPTSFSQSVHNASAGLYTIVSASQAPATSLAAGAGTFAYGWIEVEAFLAGHRDGRALLVGYDEALPDEYRPYVDHVQRTYALALLLGVADSGGLTLESVAADAEESLPLAPLFIAWALAATPTFRVTAGGQGWNWRRIGT